MNPDSADPYIFSTHSLPSDHRFLPPLTNGTLGWRVFGKILHKGGVYNGEVGACHRADIPCPLAVRMKLEEGKHTYSLDAHTGIVVSISIDNNVSLYIRTLNTLWCQYACLDDSVSLRLLQVYSPIQYLPLMWKRLRCSMLIDSIPTCWSWK